MPLQSPHGPSRRTLIAFLILYVLSVGTSVAFLSRSIGSHIQTFAVVSTRPVPAMGKHPVAVYFYNQITISTGNKDGLLMYYDVSKNRKIEILKIENRYIDSALVSPDGQWVLFIVGASYGSGGPYQLQRVRINGRQQETLYTFSAIDYGGGLSPPFISAEWSLDQNSILIGTDKGGTKSTLSIVDIATRKVRTVLQITSTHYRYSIVKWLDRTHVYVGAFGRYGQGNIPSTELYVLDVTARMARSVRDLKQLIPGFEGAFLDFDSSPDGKQLFVAQEIQNTLTIWREPATGGKQQILFHIVGASFSIDTIRVFSNSLLLTVDFGYAHKEVWRMPLDASDHTTLFRSTDYTVYLLNRMTQYSWSNVSRDGVLFALETYNRDIGEPSLFISPIHEGKITIIELFGTNQTRWVGNNFIVGWTTV